jgi:hypothetical protein
MAIEVAKGEGLKLDRRGIDADFLLDVRNRKYTYDELMSKLTELKSQMDEEISKSVIPDEISVDMVNDLLLYARNKFNQK